MCENMGLYRGKRKDNGEWIEGFYLTEEYNLNTCSVEHIPLIQPLGICVSLKVVPETVGQFTGLTVVNGKVFNGDFLRFGDRVLEVFWNGEAFQWQAKQIDTDFEIHRTCDGCHDYDWTITDLGWIAAEEVITGRITTEIIGNKWDNPKMLKDLKV